jgi:hypothetical protein
VLPAGVAIIKRNVAVESLMDLHFGTGKAKALALLRDLETLALPLDDVVVTDRALMDKPAQACWD